MSAIGSHRAGPPSDAGTTLIEALVVVAVTTLVALIGFPRLQQGLLVLAQRQAVSEVAAKLRQARAEALMRDQPIVFEVGVDGRAYGALGGQATSTPPGVAVLAAQGPGGRIVFYGDGSSSGGRILVTAARRTIPVSVAGQTGVVMVGGA